MCVTVASVLSHLVVRPQYGDGRQKTLCVTLTYVEITSSGVNCALKNLRGGKSRSGKVIKKGI